MFPPSHQKWSSCRAGIHKFWIYIHKWYENSRRLSYLKQQIYVRDDIVVCRYLYCRIQQKVRPAPENNTASKDLTMATAAPDTEKLCLALFCKYGLGLLLFPLLTLTLFIRQDFKDRKYRICSTRNVGSDYLLDAEMCSSSHFSTISSQHSGV